MASGFLADKAFLRCTGSKIGKVPATRYPLLLGLCTTTGGAGVRDTGRPPGAARVACRLPYFPPARVCLTAALPVQLCRGMHSNGSEVWCLHVSRNIALALARKPSSWAPPWTYHIILSGDGVRRSVF